MKTKNTPLQKFKFIKGDVLIGFLMDRFDYTAKEAKFLEEDLINNFDVNANQLRIWFSGNGFHIEFPDLFGFKPSHELPSEVKQTLSHHFPAGDNIYDGARIIRTGFTYNTKSGLFKTPFDIDEIFDMDMDSIKEIAKGQRMDYKYVPIISDPNQIPLEKYKIIKEDIPAVVQTDKPTIAKDNPSSFVTISTSRYRTFHRSKDID